MVADLNNLLRLKTTVIGMKMFASVDEMAAIPKIRRPTAVHTTDQIVSMASRLGWTVGITADDLVGAQCRAVIGLAPQDEKWLAGQNYVGVWHGTAEDARKRQEALDVVPYGQYQALAVSPLASGRLNPPDICLVYATPGQMIILINGLQYTGYKKFEWGVVGETACADSWGRALKTGEPSLSLPCFAERRYGGVPDEEMLMALTPSHLAKAIAGMKQLAKNGLRYPIAPYGIQGDVRAGMGVSYAQEISRSEQPARYPSLLICKGIEDEVFVEIRHRCLWRHRFHRPARRRISRSALLGRQHLKWAMAGRSMDKLTSVRDAIGAPADTPLIVADASDPASLKAMIDQTRSVLTTVGPYQLYGSELVAACAAIGHGLSRSLRRAGLDAPDDRCA